MHAEARRRDTAGSHMVAELRGGQWPHHGLAGGPYQRVALGGQRLTERGRGLGDV